MIDQTKSANRVRIRIYGPREDLESLMAELESDASLAVGEPTPRHPALSGNKPTRQVDLMDIAVYAPMHLFAGLTAHAVYDWLRDRGMKRATLERLSIAEIAAEQSNKAEAELNASFHGRAAKGNPRPISSPE